MFNDQQFSKDLKIQKARYQFQEAIDWNLIQAHLDQLNTFPLTSLTTAAQKKAFWINVYNGVTNYLIVKIPIQQQMKEVEDIFERKVITIQELHLSLNDIEHGILRRNAREHLSPIDPILTYLVAEVDYRIHFALNCGAASCPAIAFYSDQNISEELELAEQLFLASEFKVDDATRNITCSEIFKWYRADFGARFLDDPKYIGYEVIYEKYNWHI